MYAYYRHLGNERLLIIANFGDNDEHVNVHTPQHALDMMSMEPGIYQACDLLTGNKLQVEVTTSKPIDLTILRHNAMIIKLM